MYPTCGLFHWWACNYSEVIMEITKSPIEEQIETDVEEQAQTDAEKAQAAKVLQVLRGIRNGNLTFAQFKQLPRVVQITYERKYGRPKTTDQIRNAEKAVAKRRGASKRARAARKARR